MPVTDNKNYKSQAAYWFIIILGGIIASNIIIDFLFLSDAYGGNKYNLLHDIFNTKLDDDSSGPLYEAIKVYLQSDKGIYQTVFFEEKIKFQYPPTSLPLFVVLVKFGADVKDIMSFINVLSFVSIAGIIICLYNIVIVSYEKFEKSSIVNSVSFKLILFALIFIGTITYYPIMFGHKLGQIQVFLNFMISFSLLCWLKGQKSYSGVLLAFAVIFKPQFGLILFWALFRKEKQFVKGMLYVIIPMVVLSLIMFGIQEHFDYLSVLSYISKHGETYWPNQSLNGILNRVRVVAYTSGFDPNSFARYHIIVHMGTLISSALLIFFAFMYKPKWLRNNKGEVNDHERLFDFVTIIIVSTIASPVAWEHHYGVFWPIFIISFIAITNILFKNRNKETIGLFVMLGTSYLLVSNLIDYFVSTENFVPLNLLQSYIFYGGLILLAFVTILRKNYCLENRT